jgi:hypothetical protein
MSIITQHYYTRTELAAELQICERTLIRWEQRGEGPAITTLSRRPLYRRTTVAAWLASREQVAP